MLCVLLSACGDGERNNQPSGTSGVNTIQSTQSQKTKRKTNAEKFLEYAIKAADLRNFTKTGDYAGIGITLQDLYQEDIVNPYTGVLL